MDYQDFVLQLDRNPRGEGFITRVIHSPAAGEAEAPFSSPITAAELDRLWQMAHEARHRGTREFNSPPTSHKADPLVAELSLEGLGERLFQALFQGSVHSCWVRSLAEATRNSQGGLRLKLQLNLADPDLAPLAELPWEYLYSLENNGFLGLQRNTSILRTMRLPQAAGMPPAARPLRVLIVSCQPREMSPLSLKEEGGRIAAALKTLSGVETLPLHNPSIELLRDTLLRQDFHVLHFMGHGGFDAANGQGVLYFADANGERLPVSGRLLAHHLAGLRSLRLVFVNACETARGNARAPFAGVAAALLSAGQPAVIAMQRPIRDGSALEFSRAVYRRLATGDPIDAAVTEGRLAIAREHGALLEWGTPVLFLRAEDGRIFASEPVEASENDPPPAPPSWARRIALPLLLGSALLSVVASQWPPGQDQKGDTADEAEVTDRGPDLPMTTDPPVEVPEPEPKKAEAQPPPETRTETIAVRTEPVREPDPEPIRAEPPRSSPSSSYEVSEGNPVSIPGLEAEVGVQFIERDSFTLARFSVMPPGEGLLQQPPVMGTGSVEFPAQNGTYHLDVLSLDLKERRARVRLRLAS